MLAKSPWLELVVAFTISCCGSAAFAQNGADPFALYEQHKYAQAADRFEQLIKTNPSARVCYYAALSCRAAARQNRSRQLFEYVVSTYGGTTEASYAQQALRQYQAVAATNAAQQASHDLPESVKASMPPEMRKMLETPMGKKAVEEILQKRATEIATIRQAEQKGLINPQKMKVAVQSSGLAATNLLPKKHGDKDHPFTAADIARDGANGIDQTRYPNCWFEASMSSLAQLPRGQRLLSSMIRTKDDSSYIVRFPNDGVEYVVTDKDIEDSGIHNTAVWASIIECAEIQKFPSNQGANGADGGQSRLEIGLGCITGCKAEIVLPGTCSVQELSSFIGGAIKSQNPIVAGTLNEHYLGGLPLIIFPLHAYTIIGFDPSKNMVVLRNPHGRKSHRFELETDPQHLEFEQLSDGVCKMSLDKFQKYFYSVARSFI